MKILEFLGANLFLLAMLLVGTGAAIVMFRLAQLAGATDDVMAYLYWPIGLAGIFAAYYAGKHGARLLSRLL